ncbi:MAG: Glyoxalase/bleomycin resistance protein/dioxygenase [Thermoleophilia bacterium]|nr:Glyoxalase/bleomycin resistance protein/dioxygenase [Thermoleophilia bacterium]
MSDATTTQTTTPEMWAPTDSQLLPHGIELGPSHLTVRSLERALPWYTDALGLTVAEQTPTSAQLASIGGEVVVGLTEDPEATAPGKTAGLYHVALNMSRLELSRMIRRIVQAKAAIQGASDHGTHEAIYLPDPDGNGFELAADRPRADWPDWNEHPGSIQPQALDLEALFAVSGDGAIPPHAEGVTTGHLHLHVGDIEQGLAHYRDIVGFDVKFQMPTAAFVSADGYHHHLGFNVWNGVGVPGAPDHSTGLRYWSVVVPAAEDVDALAARLAAAGTETTRDDAGALLVPDPWGTTLRVTARD